MCDAEWCYVYDVDHEDKVVRLMVDTTKTIEIPFGEEIIGRMVQSEQDSIRITDETQLQNVIFSFLHFGRIIVFERVLFLEEVVGRWRGMLMPCDV